MQMPGGEIQQEAADRSARLDSQGVLELEREREGSTTDGEGLEVLLRGCPTSSQKPALGRGRPTEPARNRLSFS